MNALRRAAPLSLALFGARMSGAALAFATQALITRAWGADRLGDYLFALAAANVAAAVMPLGFQAVGGYFAAQYRASESRRALWAYLTQGYGQLAVLAVVDLAVAGVASVGPVSAMRSLWLPAMIMSIAIAVVYLNGAVLTGLKRPVAALVADILLRPALMFAGFLIASRDMASIDPLVDPLAQMLWFVAGGYSLVAMAQTTVMVATVRKVGDRYAFYPGQKRQWWRYALPWAVIGLATDFFFDIDLIMLSHFLSREDLALFGVCARVCTLLAFGVGTVYTVMMPDILEAGVKRDEARFRARIDEANLVAAILAAVFAASMFATGPLLGLVFGPQFAQAWLPLGIMSLGLIVRAGFGPAPLALSFYDRPFASVPAAAVGLATAVLANIVLVPLCGLVGAAFAATIAMAAWSATQWVVAWRNLKLDVSIYPRLRALLARPYRA